MTCARIWVWAVCLGAASGAPGDSVEMAEAGRLTGRVTYSGPMLRSRVADDTGHHRNLAEVDPATGGLGHVLVYLMPQPPGPGEEPHANARRRDRAPVMDQVHHEFVPRLLAVRAGEEVVFTNSDPANHNVRALSPVPGNSFNVSVPFETRYRHRFQSDPEQRPVVLDCDIHPWMRGWIFVFDHPWFAVTGPDGKFDLPNIPPGEHRVVLRQPDLNWRETRALTVRPGARVEWEVEAARPAPAPE